VTLTAGAHAPPGAIRQIDTQRTVSTRTGGTASSYLDEGCNEALIGAPFGEASPLSPCARASK
jgi:hypothetical protein